MGISEGGLQVLGKCLMFAGAEFEPRGMPEQI